MVGCPQAVFLNSAILQGRSLLLDAYLSKFSTPNTAYQEEINIDDYAYESDSDPGDSTDFADGFEGSIIEEGKNPPVYLIETDKVIVVPDTGFVTWQALVYYMYTGEITFATLKSGPKHIPGKESSEGNYQCSPKSMYRLADMLGLKDPKAAAIKSLSSQLTASNILDEFFSRFTFRYAEVLSMETDILRIHRTSPEVMARLWKMMTRIATGELPHCAEMLTLLFNMSE